MSAGDAGRKRGTDAVGFRCVECLAERVSDVNEALFSLMIGALPPGVRQHVLNAGRETLLAVRGLVDEMLKRQDEFAAEVAKRNTTLRRIEVE